MKRTIYHGSSRIVRTPVFGTGEAGNDFGLGFYCTDDLSAAGEWAVSRNSDGFINRYTIETDGLRIINLSSPGYCMLHWLGVLLSYREFDACSSMAYQATDYIRSVFSTDYQNCDCMIGFRADNCNFAFAQSFLEGDISYRQFSDSIRLGDTGRQFVLKSNRAFDRVLFYGYSIADAAGQHPSALGRDRRAMLRHKSILSSTDTGRKSRSDIYVDQIISERIGPYDPRLII